MRSIYEGLPTPTCPKCGVGDHDDDIMFLVSGYRNSDGSSTEFRCDGRKVVEIYTSEMFRIFNV